MLLQSEPAYTIRIRFPTEAERFVLENLFDNIAFARFYAENRPRISADVFWWVTDPTEPPDSYQCVSSVHPDGSAYYIIRLPNIPPRVDEAQTVAHELSHILLLQEGFPNVSARGNDLARSVATMLGSLLSDLVIDRWLIEQYHFQLRADLGQHLTNITAAIGDRPLPEDPLIYAQWVLTFVDTILQHKLILDQSIPSPLRQWLLEQHPKLVRDVDRLLMTIRSIGFDTPKQQRRLLRYIIRAYDLARFGIRLQAQPAMKKKLNKSKLPIFSHLSKT